MTTQACSRYAASGCKPSVTPSAPPKQATRGIIQAAVQAPDVIVLDLGLPDLDEQGRFLQSDPSVGYRLAPAD
jgi:hypothetical protein